MKKLIFLLLIVLGTTMFHPNVQACSFFHKDPWPELLNFEHKHAKLELSVVSPLKNNWEISTTIYEENGFGLKDNSHRSIVRGNVVPILSSMGCKLGVKKVIRGTVISLNADLDHNFYSCSCCR